MQLKNGDKAIEIVLPAINGEEFSSGKLQGKRYMLSFFRFAGCPFCNLHMHELSRRFSELGSNFTIVAIFDSPLDNLKKYSKKHHAAFPVVADEKNIYYRKYGIQRSVTGMIKGASMRLPSILYATLMKGYIPFAIKGKLTTMPADFLINEHGIIETAHYGNDPGDHIPFETIKKFALPQAIPSYA